MAELMKENLNIKVTEHLSEFIAQQYRQFDQTAFKLHATANLNSLELKQRSTQITQALVLCMPDSFEQSMSIVEDILGPESENETIQYNSTDQGVAGWILMPLCDFVTHFALQRGDSQSLKRALDVLKQCTSRFSSEFALRPLLRDHQELTLNVISTWVNDPNLHVRRLVSEGSRPFLPWGIRLPKFANNPNVLLPLLEQLKDDESEYVRRSVANHLNDVAKVQGDFVAELAKRWWEQDNKSRIKLLKHACRTLVKDGHSSALALFGYSPIENCDFQFSLEFEQVSMGREQLLQLNIVNNSTHQQNILIDYVVYHQGAQGRINRKVFKWTSVSLNSLETVRLTKKHSFKPVTTRRYYAGVHKIEVLLNGTPQTTQEFKLYES